MSTIETNTQSPRGPESDSPARILVDIMESGGFTKLEAQFHQSDLPPHEALPVFIEGFEQKTERVLTALGSQTTALVSRANSPRMIERWIEGRDRPQLSDARRLCVADVIVSRFSLWFPEALPAGERNHTAEAWIMGTSPQMTGGQPARAIRELAFVPAALEVSSSLYEVSI